MNSHPASSTGDTVPDFNRRLFVSDLVTIGAFRAPVEHPRFRDSGPTDAAVFVFPRTSVGIQHRGRDAFTADCHTATFYNAGQRYIRHPLDARGDNCEWFAVRPDVLLEVIALDDPSVAGRPDAPFARTHGTSDAATYALQRLVVRHVEASTEPDALIVEEAVLRVLSRLMRGVGAGNGPRNARELRHAQERAKAIVGAARDYLLEHCADSIGIDGLARLAGCSAFHLCRAFRRDVGTTIHAYRHQLRLRRSLELIAEGRLELSGVAFDLGFSSHSHFAAAFRQTFALTPSQFRRQASGRLLRDFARRLPAGR
jgi:AraC family transcriptional regulator